MFGSFQASQPPEELPKAARPPKHPGGTAFACLECRRRKSRCDGLKPCSRCREGNKELLCQYVSPKPRIIPSQKALNQLSEQLQQTKAVLEKLLPPVSDYADLQDMSRKDLIDMILRTNSPAIGSLRTDSIGTAQSPGAGLPSDGSLVLEQLNTNTTEYDEQTDDVADDVNALSMSTSRHSSYVGSSSISAALKVMAILCPDIMKHSSLTAPNSPFDKSDRSSMAQTHISRELEASYVNAYFAHVHDIVPMVHEARFRARFQSRDMEHEPSWGVLLNMVLAMGSIAGETVPESNHAIFYQRAKSMLSFDLFGSGKLEVVQALALMGGFYLHYCNRPNMASAILGAALRMAYALGLHRKSPSELLGERPLQIPAGELETKRRTWWSLVCLDIWGSTTLGRPSMGDCFGPAISIHMPLFSDFKDHPVTDQAPALVAATQFCSISAQIQHKLASKPILGLAEAALFDHRLQEQYASLPDLLRSPNRCPQNLLVPRAIIKWQYQNARLLLHRPILLAAALSYKSPAELSPAEQDSVAACRTLAADSIVDIACDWQQDPMCGWHAVWYLFQASMVPLVSLFYEYFNATECGKWHGQIEMVLRLLQSMELWSPMAKRTRDVIVELHQSSMQMQARQSGEEAPGANPVLRMDMQQMWQQGPGGQQMGGGLPGFVDDNWASNTWFNWSEWPAFPMEGADLGGGGQGLFPG